MFNKYEFDRIWNNTIEPLIVDFCETLKIKSKPLIIIKFLLSFNYNRLRKTIVKAYMSKKTINIDRHKVSACIMKSILIVSPLYIPLIFKIRFLFSKKKYISEIINPNAFDKCNNFEKYYIYLNEYLALSVAISIMDGYIKSDEKRFSHEMIIPNPFPKPDIDYLLDVCIGLYCSSLRKCNPITFANIFFLWEKYSCRKKRCDNLATAYKDLISKHNVLISKYNKLLERSSVDMKKLEIEVDDDENELELAVERAMLAEQADRLLSKTTDV